jgi:hypothetical protein
MATQFSDPAWWPQPPPKPPKPIPLAKILFGTFLPLVVGVGVLIWALNQHGSPAPALPAQSIAAFEACLRAHGTSLGEGGKGPSQPVLEACVNRLPPGTRLNGIGAQESAGQERAQRAFDQCMQSAMASVPHGGRFGGAGARNAIQNAEELCRTLVDGSDGRPAATTTGPATGATAPPAT